MCLCNCVCVFQALDALDKALQQSPSDLTVRAELYFSKGNQLREMNQLDQAFEVRHSSSSRSVSGCRTQRKQVFSPKYFVWVLQLLMHFTAASAPKCWGWVECDGQLLGTNKTIKVYIPFHTDNQDFFCRSEGDEFWLKLVTYLVCFTIYPIYTT